MTTPPLTRPISEIAREISVYWTNPYFGAVPYINAMTALTDMESNYYEDDAETILIYFMSNATGWRGEKAREIKAEIKALLKKAK